MRFNDKTNPQVVMVAYMTPKPVHLAVCRAIGASPSRALALLLDRATHQFQLIEVAQ